MTYPKSLDTSRSVYTAIGDELRAAKAEIERLRAALRDCIAAIGYDRHDLMDSAAAMAREILNEQSSVKENADGRS